MLVFVCRIKGRNRHSIYHDKKSEMRVIVCSLKRLSLHIKGCVRSIQFCCEYPGFIVRKMDDVKNRHKNFKFAESF